MFDGEAIFEFFDALPGLIACALGFWVLWLSIFAPEIRFGMSRKNTPVRGPLAILGRIFTAMIALYAISMGGKVAIDRLSVWPGLSRRLGIVARVPIGTIVEIALLLFFSAAALNGAATLVRRDSDRKERIVGAGSLVICGLVALAIFRFFVCARQ